MRGVPTCGVPTCGSVGLNLTRAALDAVTKYPWPKGGVPGGEQRQVRLLRRRPGDRRLGSRRRPDRPTCLEAQVMDWADDVAYPSTMSEDGVVSGESTCGCWPTATPPGRWRVGHPRCTGRARRG